MVEMLFAMAHIGKGLMLISIRLIGLLEPGGMSLLVKICARVKLCSKEGP